jgi:hypothetical protein
MAGSFSMIKKCRSMPSKIYEIQGKSPSCLYEERLKRLKVSYIIDYISENVLAEKI